MNEKLVLIDKELAEKVAEKLGWHFDTERKAYARFIDGQFDGWICSYLDLEERIFSWPTFGLMVEDAERRGWCVVIYGGDRIEFHRMNAKEHTITTAYDYTRHGHIKACALAYVEIPNE
jgi:hypothetical protein